jgi:hypothetical protein
MPSTVNVTLDRDDELTLRAIMTDLGLSPQEVLVRSLRLAGAARALNNIHGVHSAPDQFVPEGVIW